MAEQLSERISLATLAQRSWWLYEQYGHGEVVTCAFQLHGELCVPVLRASLKAIVQRHDSLRTTFRQQAGQIWQVVAPPDSPATALHLHVVDVPGPTRQARLETARTLLGQERQRPFDLAAGPLIRAQLYKLGTDDHIVVVGVHHIVTDGTSMAIMLRELGALYAAFLNGQPSPLPAAMQYPEFTAWQHTQLHNGVLKEQLERWISLLAKTDLHLELSTKRARPARLPYRAKTRRFEISEAAAQAVRGTVRPHRVTPFMVLLAAFQWLLAGWASTPDVIVCAPAANRVRPGANTVVGLLFNEVLYKARIRPSMTVGELLGHVRQVATEALADQEVPLEAILLARGVSLDQAQRGLDYTAWFQVEHEGSCALRLPGCRAARLELQDLDSSEDDEQPVDWDPTVSLVVTERTDGSLGGAFTVNASMLDEGTVAMAARRYNRLLASMSGTGEDALSACWPSWRLA